VHHIDKVLFVTFKKHKPHHRVAKCDKRQLFFARVELLLDHREGIHGKVLLLYDNQLLDVILELLILELLEVLGAVDHVLDQLSDFLVELQHIRFAVDKINYRLPLVEKRVSLLLLAASETADHLAD